MERVHEYRVVLLRNHSIIIEMRRGVISLSRWASTMNGSLWHEKTSACWYKKIIGKKAEMPGNDVMASGRSLFMR